MKIAYSIGFIGNSSGIEVYIIVSGKQPDALDFHYQSIY